jgi:hypothetical protein
MIRREGGDVLKSSGFCGNYMEKMDFMIKLRIKQQDSYSSLTTTQAKCDNSSQEA